MSQGPIAALRQVSRVFAAGETEVRALDEIDLEIHRNDYVSLVGTSGSGKTTLLNMLGGIDRPTLGEVYVDGARIDGLSEQKLLRLRRWKVAYVFQEPRLVPSLTALENVMLPSAFSGDKDGTAEARAVELLDKVGLGKRVSHLAHQLSGGEAQRVCIARALFNRPALILADEPTGNLDHQTRLDIVRLFENLTADGNTVVMVTHDPELAGRARRKITIQDGRILDDRHLQ
jgi:putative ABC transport system ATP-binding protein